MKRLIAIFILLAAARYPVVAQTWIELFPAGGPSGAILGRQPVGYGYDALNNRFIVYFQGNPAVGSPSPEVWVLTNANGLGGTPVWTQLSPVGVPPSSNGISGVVYEPGSNRLIAYGGCYANCSPALSEARVLINANGLGGTPAWLQLTVTNSQARVGHSAVFSPANNFMISFAGHLAFYGTDQSDTRVLSNANGLSSPSTWSTLSVSGGPPGIRTAHGAVYDQASNRMTIFGGVNLIRTCCPYVQSNYNDTWVLSNANGLGGTPTWVQLFPSGSLPDGRYYHSTAYDSANNRMIVYGGLKWNQATQSDTRLDDLWQLSSANGIGLPTWTQVVASGTSPGPNYSHVAAFDSANRRMIVFGGSGQKRVWVLAFPPTPPVPVNRPPDARDDVGSIVGGAATIRVLDNDVDPDSDPLTILQVIGFEVGEARIEGQVIVYTPGPKFRGRDYFRYTISDGRGGTDTANVMVAAGRPDVPNPNRRPVALPDDTSTSVNSPVEVRVLDNDSDPDGDPLAVSIQVGPRFGTASVLSSRAIRYAPNHDYSGPDELTYQISDGRGGGATAKVTVTIGGPCVADITRNVDVTRPYTWGDIGGGTVQHVIRITNLGSVALQGPLALVFDSAETNKRVSVINKQGETKCLAPLGSDYVVVVNLNGDDRLSPGESIDVNNVLVAPGREIGPSTVTTSYTNRVLAGQGAR